MRNISDCLGHDAVLRRAMPDEKRDAMARVVLHGQEETVLLRPMGNVLAMSLLNVESKVTKPLAFEDQVPRSEPSAEELHLTKRLIDLSTAKKFDFAAFKDEYTAKLTKLIEAKAAGEEIAVAPVSHEPAHIINLMDALRASVAEVQDKGGGPATKPPKKLAPSTGKEVRGRKRKTS